MVQLLPTFAAIYALVACVSGSVINMKREPLQPWDSLAGRSQDEIEDFIKRHGPAIVGAQPLPAQPTDTSKRLVHDANHQYIAPEPGFKRGPCPGMNSMSNHGVRLYGCKPKRRRADQSSQFYNRNGVDTPQALIQGSMDGEHD